MRHSLALLVGLAAAQTAWADPPPEQVIEAIQELRRQVGEQGQVIGDQQEFAQAIREQLQDPQAGTIQKTFDPPRNEQPPRQAFENRFTDRYQDPTQPSQGWQYGPPPHHKGSYDVRAGWNLAERGRTPDSTQPRHPGPPRGPRPDESPKTLLRNSAFELDRMAHDLEMRELFDEADALRDAASKLRKTARKSAKGDPRATENHTSDKARKTDKKSIEKSLRKRWAEMEEKSAQLQPIIDKLRRERKQAKPRHMEHEEEHHEKDHKDRDATRQDRLEEGQPPQLGPSHMPPKRDLHLLAPPKGVHGGPTEEPAESDEDVD